jgi:hypothetical protein
LVSLTVSELQSLRILISGSRDWSDPGSMRRAVQSYLSEHRDRASVGVVLVHGGAAHGADRLASDLADACGFEQEVYPALWDEHGKPAGVIRNIEMVKSHPDVVLAFACSCRKSECAKLSVHPSHGTAHLVKTARVAGLPMMVCVDQSLRSFVLSN